jgi:hypothetical protein
MEQYNFFGSPIPHQTESFSSWFQRFCQQQGLGFHRALSHFKISENCDLDYQVNSSIIQNIISSCSIPATHFNVYKSISRTISNNRAVRKKLRVTPRGEATTGFCTKCLQSDEHPYLRIEWRFIFWKICPIHNTNIEHVCRSCSNQIILEKSILTASNPAPTLNYCKYCFSQFSTRIPTRLNVLSDAEIENTVEIQKKLMAVILYGYGNIAPLKNKVTPTVLIRLLDAGFISTGEKQDFFDDIPKQQERYLKIILKKFKMSALKIERRKNWRDIKERTEEKKIRKKPANKLSTHRIKD